jgi:hypothetical protein
MAKTISLAAAARSPAIGQAWTRGIKIGADQIWRRLKLAPIKNKHWRRPYLAHLEKSRTPAQGQILEDVQESVFSSRQN